MPKDGLGDWFQIPVGTTVSTCRVGRKRQWKTHVTKEPIKAQRLCKEKPVGGVIVLHKGFLIFFKPR